MADAVLWKLAEACQDKLRNVNFVSQGDEQVASIEDNAIIIRKSTSSQRDSEEWFKDIDLPAIVITLPRKVIWDSSKGENNRDEGVYPILFQIIDTDDGEPEHGLRTHLKWQEQISRLFRSQPMDDPCEVYGTQVVDIDVVNEKLWVRHRLFVGGVAVRFLSLEPRGV
jgi:hypothetical protein